MVLDLLGLHDDILANDTIGSASRDKLGSLLSDQDIIRKDAEDAERTVELTEEIQREIGDSFPLHGQVLYDKYDETKRLLEGPKSGLSADWFK